MFEHLSSYSKILVTGPQRSGTRIAAEMIAEDTGLRYIDEEEFGVRSKKNFNKLLANESNIVVQCPGMCRIIHEHSASDTLIVMMIRDVEDIVASEERVDWIHGYWDELVKYGIPHTNSDLRTARREGVRPSVLKYDFWEKEQRDKITNYMELEYESLAEHSMWIPKEDRKNFTEKQTK